MSSEDPIYKPDLSSDMKSMVSRIERLERSILDISLTIGANRLAFDRLQLELNKLKFVSQNDPNLNVFEVRPSNLDSTESLVQFRDVNDAIVISSGDKHEGLQYPQIHVPVAWQPSSYQAISSSSWVTVWESELRWPVADTLAGAFALTSDAGTTGEIKLVEQVGGNATSVYTVAASTNITLGFAWIHPLTVGWGDPTASINGSNVQLQARRTGGTGNINIYKPRYVVLANQQWYSYSSTTGGWTSL